MNEVMLVLRLSRRWIHYGIFAHTIICIAIGAIEGMIHRVFA